FDQAGISDDLALLDRRQIVNLHLHSGKSIARLRYARDGARHGRIDQAGYRSAMHDSLQLQEFLIQFNTQHRPAVLHSVESKPQHTRITIRINQSFAYRVFSLWRNLQSYSLRYFLFVFLAPGFLYERPCSRTLAFGPGGDH